MAFFRIKFVTLYPMCIAFIYHSLTKRPRIYKQQSDSIIGNKTTKYKIHTKIVNDKKNSSTFVKSPFSLNVYIELDKLEGDIPILYKALRTMPSTTTKNSQETNKEDKDLKSSIYQLNLAHIQRIFYPTIRLYTEKKIKHELFKLGVMVYTCNHSTQEDEKRPLKLKVSLVFLNSRPHSTTQWQRALPRWLRS